MGGWRYEEQVLVGVPNINCQADDHGPLTWER